MAKIKLFNFDFGTLKVKGSEIIFSISKNEFTYSNLEEIRELIYENDPSKFLELKDMFEEGESVKLVYENLEGMLPLSVIKKEEHIVKLSIAQAILKDRIDDIDEYSVSLHPSAIFYRPMSLVKYSYRANRFMPHKKENILKLYKALVVYIVSGIPYEKCLNHPEEVEKKGNELIKSLYKATDLDQLQKLITDACDFVTYQYVNNNKNKEKKVKRNYLYGSIAALFLATGLVGMVKSQANEQQQIEVEKVEAKYQSNEAKLKAESLFANKKYEEAATAFLDSGMKKSDVADKLIDVEKYNVALNVDPSKLDEVIDTLYQNKQKKDILDLKIPKGNKKQKEELDIEKAIVAYNAQELKNLISFTTDKELLNRMANAFLENGDINTAKEIQNKTGDKKLATSIELKVKKGELLSAKDELTAIKNMKKSKSRTQKRELQRQRIKELEDAISKLEKEVNS